MDTTGVDDVQLLLSLRHGDERAFWALWLKHSHRLFSVCLREMSGNRVDAEDALHDALLRAHEKMPRFAARIQCPSSWLIRMTSNVCKDIYRKRTRSTQIMERFGTLQSDRVQMPDIPADHRESENYDPAALATLLPDRLRDVFVLRVLQQAAYRDIATRLGLSCATARKRVQESRATLRAWRLEHVAVDGREREQRVSCSHFR